MWNQKIYAYLIFWFYFYFTNKYSNKEAFYYVIQFFYTYVTQKYIVLSSCKILGPDM